MHGTYEDGGSEFASRSGRGGMGLGSQMGGRWVEASKIETWGLKRGRGRRDRAMFRFLVEVEQVFDESQESNIATHRLQVLLVDDEDAIAREVAHSAHTLLTASCT